ncbi:hypothetical protein H4I96_12137 [Botrytis cinerea]
MATSQNLTITQHGTIDKSRRNHKLLLSCREYVRSSSDPKSPIEEPADVLLLGCGDLRNILFTLYADRDLTRPTDVTCCDIEAATIARNVLILTLILDDEHGVLNLKLWSIYYHLYLDDASLELLSTQASKLCDLAKSLESWHNGKYGHMLRFCNSSTMKRVRNVWNTYCFPKFDCPEHKSWAQHAASAIQRAMDSRNARVGSSANVLSEMRSAAPASIRAITDAPKLERHFWDHGTTDEEPASVSNTGHINPMFVTDASTLHYGTDPLLGFHLVTAYSSLKKESPLQTKASREKQLPFKVVEAARVQFEAWGRKHIKLTWKQGIAGLASDTTNTRAMLQLNEVELARTLYKMYLDMFPHENMQLLFSDFSPGFLSKQSMPRYHRGSFALILRFLRNRIATNWNVMMSNLLDLIETEMSFLVPTWTLLLEPQDAKIAFGIQSTPDATRTFISALGVEMNIFETTLGDEKSVFFTRFAPNQKDDSSLMLHPSSRISGPSTEKSGVNNTISANIDLATLKLTTLTCRLYMLSSDLQRALQSGGAVQTSQKSPCTFFETVGPNSIPIVFHFPAPVIRMKSRTRIARKSLYIEVEAPLADVTTWKDFPAYLYPVLLTRNIPILWNMSRLNLECLPIIDTSKKVEIQWLNTHIGGMFNTRERQLKAQATAATAKGDVRFAFRDSLLTLFMLFTGLQGHKSHITTLNNPTGGGVHVIILVSSLKLDLSNRTVFLDCAMLPLTHKLMPQLGLFLRDFSGLEVCHIEVDTDEIQLWRQNLPAMMERCRSWSHQVCCEYRAQDRIPLSIENGHQVICSCGNGKFPTDFIDGIPHWKSVSRYFVRAAISLCFSAAFSEQLVDLNIFREKLCPMPP